MAEPPSNEQYALRRHAICHPTPEPQVENRPGENQSQVVEQNWHHEQQEWDLRLDIVVCPRENETQKAEKEDGGYDLAAVTATGNQPLPRPARPQKGFTRLQLGVDDFFGVVPRGWASHGWLAVSIIFLASAPRRPGLRLGRGAWTRCLCLPDAGGC